MARKPICINSRIQGFERVYPILRARRRSLLSPFIPLHKLFPFPRKSIRIYPNVRFSQGFPLRPDRNSMPNFQKLLFLDTICILQKYSLYAKLREKYHKKHFLQGQNNCCIIERLRYDGLMAYTMLSISRYLIILKPMLRRIYYS